VNKPSLKVSDRITAKIEDRMYKAREKEVKDRKHVGYVDSGEMKLLDLCLILGGVSYMQTVQRRF